MGEMNIITLELEPGFEVDFVRHRNQLAYTFELNGEKYGLAVNLPSRSTEHLLAAALQLFTNAIQTRNSLQK